MPEPRKRKQNRGTEPVEDVPLAHPQRDKRATRTLVDIIAERSRERNGSPLDATHAPASQTKPQLVTMRPDGQLANYPRPPLADEEIGALGEAIVYGISLSMIHFTLDLLVHNQYAERVVMWDLLPRSLVGFFILTLLIYILHPHAHTWGAQILFLAGSIAAGCFLIEASTKHSYLAVMKQAPPLCTLWIWAVLEQRSEVALLGLLAVGGYFWWGGYSILS